MFEFLFIVFAFFIGFLVKKTGFPPLIGYLGAGFLISYYSSLSIEGLPQIPSYTKDVISHLAHLGVILLLFTVGLKLNVKKVVKPEVIGTSIFHFLFTLALFTPIIHYFFDIVLYNSFLLAAALSFSSTVLAAKFLEDKREMKAFHGRVTIGILIMQDIIALTVISIASGKIPSMFALCVFLLPLLRPLLFKLIDNAGHEELLVLLTLSIAIIIGGYGFPLVGLSGELGALVMGVLVSKHPKVKEISNGIWNIKELFLVAFFVSIGLNGLPTINDFYFAIIVGLLLSLKGILMFFLLIGFKLKSRSAFLSTTLLTNYSEFGLILAALVLPEYLMPLALAMVFSFIISAPLNKISHNLFDKYSTQLESFNRDSIHPDELPANLGTSNVIIFGAGHIGKSVFHNIKDKKDAVILDSDQDKIKELNDKGIKAFFADAEDVCFWRQVNLSVIETVVLTMTDHEAKIVATKKLRKNNFTGKIIAHSLHQDEADEILEAGATATYLTSTETGIGLSTHI